MSLSPKLEAQVNKFANSLRIGAKPQYEADMRRFVAAVKGDYSKEKLMSYINGMLQQGYAVGTISRKVVPMVKKFYKVNDIPWPLRKGETPRSGEADVRALAISSRVIARLIMAAGSPSVNQYNVALLALSTTYGMRRVELASLTPKSVDIKSGMIYVKSAKGSRERWHMIPDEIKPQLDVRFKKLTDWAASKAFWEMEQAAGIIHKLDTGWHSIRRMLIKELVTRDLPDQTVRSYMRWKRSEFGGDMLGLYFTSTVIDDDAEVVESSQADKDVDRSVIKVHPYLPIWRELNARTQA